MARVQKDFYLKELSKMLKILNLYKEILNKKLGMEIHLKCDKNYKKTEKYQ